MVILNTDQVYLLLLERRIMLNDVSDQFKGQNASFNVIMKHT